ncbi:3-keto-disaccharide hydrolase [Ohtaekwangia sp.]|uniref:3-keto-disaccharide hydrolase n=1 Tax=Ohtaekwangia sp. TaxID=2066019 RepID=UPI002F94E97E
MQKANHLLVALALLGAANAVQAQDQPNKKTPESSEIWEPQPRIITPAEKTGDAPSDATVLFDGKSLDNWVCIDGTAPKWTIKDGAVTVVAGSKDIKTKKEFGDFQLHVEWRSPAEVDPKQVSQGRGNSGIFLQERYEVQVLDNYNNKTYANGQASSIYKQHIPLVNACRKPGEWQVYDIYFTAPRFNAEGRVLVPAYVTVVHNGVLSQNHVAIWGPTEYIGLPVYKAYEKGPIRLQDHGNPVSYRNIWIRDL